MFTGIIETIAVVEKKEFNGSNIDFYLSASIASDLKIDQSVSHNGVCLTVVGIQGNSYCVTAIKETLDKSNLKNIQIGDKVNLERCMIANGRIDGHLVQGHVDSTARCITIDKEEGSVLFTFEILPEFAHLIVEKGSICLNGISLTIFNVGSMKFSVAIIPYTFEHTNIHGIKVGDEVNIEFDIIGKYLSRYKELI